MAATLRGERGVTVTYTRRKSSVSLVAIAGRTPTQIDSQDQGVRIESRMRDWLLLANEIVIGGIVVTPIQGDTITESNGAVWRIVDFGGEPCWRYSDATRIQIRVHSQLIEGDG